MISTWLPLKASFDMIKVEKDATTSKAVARKYFSGGVSSGILGKDGKRKTWKDGLDIRPLGPAGAIYDFYKESAEQLTKTFVHHGAVHPRWGWCLALVRISRLRSLSAAVGPIWLMRGTPLMLQLLFIYFALPFVPVIGVRLPDFPSAVVAFALNYAAYFAEIFRAGIQSIDRGQYEGPRCWA